MSIQAIINNFVNFPNELLARIFSFVPAASQGKVAQVCHLFNQMIHSGSIEGKNSREYLVHQLQKKGILCDRKIFKVNINHIREVGLTLLRKKFLRMKITPEVEGFIPTDIEKFMSNYKNYFDYLETKGEDFTKFTDLVIKIVKKSIEKDRKIKNKELQNLLNNPKSSFSQIFVRSLIVRFLKKLAREINYDDTLFLHLPSEISVIETALEVYKNLWILQIQEGLQIILTREQTRQIENLDFPLPLVKKGGLSLDGIYLDQLNLKIKITAGELEGGFILPLNSEQIAQIEQSRRHLPRQRNFQLIIPFSVCVTAMIISYMYIFYLRNQ